MLETIIAAHFLGVDAFDQPAPEEGKLLAKEYLGASSLAVAIAGLDRAVSIRDAVPPQARWPGQARP